MKSEEWKMTNENIREANILTPSLTTHNSQLTIHNSHINLIFLDQPESISVDIHDLEIGIFT